MFCRSEEGWQWSFSWANFIFQRQLPDRRARVRKALYLYTSVFFHFLLICFYNMLQEGWGRGGNSSSDLNLKMEVRVRGQKTRVQVRGVLRCLLSLSLSLSEGRKCGNLTPGWGQLCKSVQTSAMLSDKVSPLLSSTKEKERRRLGGSGLPDPSEKGNYILIPFRNLAYIWLPGTSSNCLQCLSLCLLGVCVRCFLRAQRHKQPTDRTVEAVSRPQPDARWSYYYASGFL